MSRFEIKMPKLGESITEGTIVSWSVKVGESVQEDDVLFEVNTAKVSAEIPSPVAGKVMEILCKEGDTVAVGTVVAVINLDGDSASEQETSNESNSSQETTKEKSHNEVPKPGVAVEERWYSPVVIQLARDAKIPKEELDTLQGTGYEGRLSKKDIKDYIDRKKRGLVSEPKPATIGITSASPKSSPVPAVQSVASTATPQSSAPINTSGVEMKEMDRVRRIIADHMVMSKKVSPHVTNVLEVDVTKLVRWREKNKDVFFRHEGVKLTYMPMITEAVAKALVTYPQLNVSVDGYNIPLIHWH